MLYCKCELLECKLYIQMLHSLKKCFNFVKA